MRIRVRLKSFMQEEHGVVAIIVALMLTVLMGFMALGIDVASLYFRQKALQTHADLAAVSAVSNLAEDPRYRAVVTMDKNGLAAEALTSIEYGRYIRDPSINPDNRLETRTLSDIDVNSARVSLFEDVPLYFARTFVDQDTTRIRAKATAARFDTASFSLASTLARLDEGILNAVLSEALGTEIELAILDYSALLDADIDLLTFSDALASRLDLTAGNYEELVVADADLADIAGALLDANLGEDITGTLTTIIDSGSSPLLNVSDLIMFKGENVTALVPDIMPEITVSAFDLLKASADIINAERHVEIDLDLDIDGLISAELDLVVGEHPAGSGWITIGERGATLHTAQTRFKLDLNLTPDILSSLNSGLDITSIHLPVYIEVASATASLTEIDCSASEPDDVIARFDTGTDPLNGVTGSHIAEIFLGEFDVPAFNDTTTPLSQATLRPADFLGVHIRPLGLGLLDAVVSIEAYAPMGISEQAEKTFTFSDLETGGGALSSTFGSGNILEGAVSRLVANAELDIELSVLNLNLGIVNALLRSVLAIVEDLSSDILSSLLIPLDEVLDELLKTLGLGVGQGKLTLHNVACGRMMLVR